MSDHMKVAVFLGVITVIGIIAACFKKKKPTSYR